DSVAPITLNTRPTITSDDALKAAKKNFTGTPQSQTSELLVYPGQDGKYNLAYRVELTDLQSNNPSKMNYFIDAKTGKVIDQFNALPILLRNGSSQSGAQTSSAANVAAPNGNT